MQEQYLRFCGLKSSDSCGFSYTNRAVDDFRSSVRWMYVLSQVCGVFVLPQTFVGGTVVSRSQTDFPRPFLKRIFRAGSGRGKSVWLRETMRCETVSPNSCWKPEWNQIPWQKRQSAAFSAHPPVKNIHFHRTHFWRYICPIMHTTENWPMEHYFAVLSIPEETMHSKGPMSYCGSPEHFHGMSA